MLSNEHMTQYVLSFSSLFIPCYLQLKSGTTFVNNMTSANKYKNKQINK